MNRPRKKKEPTLMDELRERNLLSEGEVVEIPDLQNNDLIEENSMSVIGLDDRVRGRGVGDNRVQFIFETEGDLYHVLYRGPWFVNGWIVSLDQWKPNPGPDFLNKILFWVRIRNIPIHLLKKQAVEIIIEPRGKVVAVELHAKNSNSLEYVRARAWYKADEPLEFVKNARFSTGEVVKVEIEYEKLLKKAKDRLQRPGGREQRKQPWAIQEWRPKGITIHQDRAEEGSAKGEGAKSSSESICSPSKKRRLSNNGERKSKKAKTGDSPSVFERLGNSGERVQKSSREGSLGGKNKSSPTVFDRLGTQAASSSPKSGASASFSSHSAQVAAHLLNHSAQVAAKSPIGAIRHLREIRGRYFPEITFLCETKNKRDYLENVLHHLGYFDIRTVEPVGKSGGLALMWRESVSVKVLQADNRMIDALINWQEKIGGPLRKDATCAEFRQMLSVYGMWDIKHTVYQFSWYGNRNDELVQCRLDRTVANQLWMELFPSAQAEYLQKVSSDHSPLITSLLGEQRKKWATFRYDQRWIAREGFKELISNFWRKEGVVSHGSMMSRIAACRKEISRWKRDNQPSSARRIQALHHQIDLATRQNPFSRQELLKLKNELKIEYRHEETYWKDKSRLTWLNNGDKNTKFFHAATKNKRAQNRIQRLVDDEGKAWFGDNDLGRLAENYFKLLFTSEDVGHKVTDKLGEGNKVSPVENAQLLKEVTLEEVKHAVFAMNPSKSPGPDGMTGHFYQQNWDVLGEHLLMMVQGFFHSGSLDRDMNKTNICLIPKKIKAERLTDFRPISLSNVVYKIIAKVMANRLKKVLPGVVSETQAAFIKGRLITDNILVAHELLHALDSPNKCSEDSLAIKTDISKAFDRVEWSFLQDALKLLDNILVAHELLHALDSPNKCSEDSLAIKTDISKAFDRVEWSFLQDALKLLGFSERWIRLIMTCVRTVNYQVLINGSPFGEITPTRGLRQGDPLSPYLFVLCSEILVRMLQDAESRGKITGLKVARSAPSVSHLLFTDDSIFYCKENDDELQHLISILDEYNIASGQRINYQKSSIYFGRRITQERRDLIKALTGIAAEGGQGFYLGLPEAFGGSKVTILRYLKERLQHKVSGWQTNFLSFGGKEILLKSIAMALPSHTISCFKLPKTVSQQLASVMADFWWRNKQNSKGMHWRAWEHLSKPKSEGGLGFKEIEAYNIALFGKQLWRMLMNPNSLIARVFKSRYFSKSSPLSAKLGSRPSFAWRSIHEAQELLKQGVRAIIGNGESVNLWQDPWLGSKPALSLHNVCIIPSDLHKSVSKLMKVKDIMEDSRRAWRQDLLDTLFTMEDRNSIGNLRLNGHNRSDSYTWDYARTGQYSVKSGYWVLTQVINTQKGPQAVTQPSLNPLISQVWRTKASPKVQHFLWRCLSNCLSVAKNLSHRHLSRDNSCVRCPHEAESTNHLLFQCTYARQVWALSPIPAPSGGEWSNSLYANMFFVLNAASLYPQRDDLDKDVPWVLWRLWKSRNELIFKGKDFNPQNTVETALEDAEEWDQRKKNEHEKLTRGHPVPKRTEDAKWKLPPREWVKCNTDGAWRGEDTLSGTGWVLRNNTGDVLWMGAQAIRCAYLAMEVELEASGGAIHSMLRLNYTRVIFESDSLGLVNLLNSEEIWHAFAPLLYDIKCLISSFQDFKIVYVPRVCNSVADRVARESLSFENYDPKFYSMMSSWIKHFVVKDKQSVL
ncbi:PREDICTED: uncharacterized protein LOC104767890 [Camelina sativa]|uniref:Uncharacterized protein LOC104767890 n=1 Tax=Camelina sativa TaxID=90675 RepID=A0ABM0XS37_CAMSA|nr:PREDICTED: uncharacterized protein LOC104767890 [Camelina sativa]